MQNTFALQVFHEMFEEAQRSLPPSRQRLAALLGASPEAIDVALSCLERAGLVDAKRARLTFPGLAVAAATRTSASGFAAIREVLAA